MSYPPAPLRDSKDRAEDDLEASGDCDDQLDTAARTPAAAASSLTMYTLLLVLGLRVGRWWGVYLDESCTTIGTVEWPATADSEIRSWYYRLFAILRYALVNKFVLSVCGVPPYSKIFLRDGKILFSKNSTN